MTKTLTIQADQSHSTYNNFSTDTDFVCGHKFIATSEAWAYLSRADNPTKPVASNALYLLGKLRLKLRQSPTGLEMSYDDIRKELRKEFPYSNRQIKRLLDQLGNVFTVEVKPGVTSRRNNFQRYYFLVIKYTEKGERILEAGKGEGYSADIINVDFQRRKVIKSNSSKSQEQSDLADPSRLTNLSTSYKEEEIKDKDIATNEAIFSKDYSQESESQIIPISDYIPKPLEEHHPLTEKDAVELRERSGKPFNLRYINMLLLKLAKGLILNPPPPPYNGRFTKKGAMTYMTNSLAQEKRQIEVVNRENFHFRAKEGTPEYEANRKSAYLSKIENSIANDAHNVIRRKIAGSFNDDEAFDLLTGCSWPYWDIEPKGRYVIHAPDSITELHRFKITKIVHEVLGEGVKVAFNKKTNTANKTEKKLKVVEPKSELWKKAKPFLIARCGEAIWLSWFSGCEAYEKNGRVVVTAQSSFKRDWIKNHYDRAIEDAIREVVEMKDWIEYELSNESG